MGAAEGGFGWAMAGAALASARQGAPIGLRVGGAAMAAPVGALGGFARGVWDNKGLYRAGMIKQALGGTFGTSGRYAGNYLNYGNNAGGALSGAMGGSTPGYLKPVETGFSTMTKSVTEQNRLKRMERAAYEETTLPQRILSLGALKTDQWSANVKLAELEKARKEAYHEELKKQMSIANPNQRDFKALRDIAQTSFKQ